MERAIRFLAPVNNQTADLLISAVDNLLAQGTKKLRLLISTPGGSVFHGLSIYNFIKGLPIETDTYNFGSVDSIGVVIFSAGKKRYSVPHSRFLIHGVKFNISGQLSIDEKQLEEYLKGLQIDQANIAKVIADTCGKTIERIYSDMHNRTTLSPQEAIDYGLVHSIQDDLIPSGMHLTTIGEPIQGQAYQTRQFNLPG
ncbi:MAG: hypothetical protein DWQ44_13585 [Bacteroidetes bacterium]|nr:MAG: hypothetical protein DWQ33_08395 [Bacteroidota bacterium]REK05707.1 MAG: hypothetical protein DWQ39_04660 [Bacteroidota bacterium]REK31987.1 MAG: hypothetical protein DWQ44_13585 [Bacteroidota bacterium]REK50051.1 MAG: hypothetical protein DWQ48_05805 [Bacteroidota bacterium]